MRILVVGAVMGGTVPIGNAVYKAFKEIGIDSAFLDFSTLQQEFLEIWATKDEEKFYQFHIKKKITLLQKVTDFKPDVIFGIAQSPLNDIDILTELKKAGIGLCYWFMEDYLIFDYWKIIARHFDYFFTIQKEPFWHEMRQTGCTNYHYLPMAFDTHFKCSDEKEGSEIPISFVGAPYPNRVHFFSRFSNKDFQIYGEDWNKYPNPFVVIGDRRITEDEVSSIYRRSIININLHSSQFPSEIGNGDFVNPRTFELAGMGCFQLTDMRKLLTLHFDPAEEIIALSSWEDMTKAVEYFLKHDNERKDIAKRAQTRVLREHTYQHRAQEIVSLLK